MLSVGYCLIQTRLTIENRTTIIEKIGEDNYHNVYNSLSIASTLTIATGFLRRNKYTLAKHGLFDNQSKLIKSVSLLTRGLGLFGLSQVLPRLQSPFVVDSKPMDLSKEAVPSQSTVEKLSTIKFKSRCPMDFKSEGEGLDGVKGMDRISRHSVLFSFASLALSFALGTSLTPLLITYFTSLEPFNYTII